MQLEVVVRSRALIIVFILLVSFGHAGVSSAHGTGKHVMGTATAVEADRLGVKTKDGKDVTVVLTPKTQFRRSGPAALSANLQVGDRVVVEVTDNGKQLTATEVRFATPVAKK
jgi:exosome complex RNA-binding protein Csl4